MKSILIVICIILSACNRDVAAELEKQNQMKIACESAGGHFSGELTDAGYGSALCFLRSKTK